MDTGSHFYDSYETRDGKFMAVGAIEPQFYAVLLEKLGLTDEELPQYYDFEENREKLAGIFKKKTQKEWCVLFDGTDACVTPVLALDEVSAHEHNKKNNSFTVANDGSTVPNPAARLSRTPGSCAARHASPATGEHTREILSEFGFDSKKIEDLVASGVIQHANARAKL